jgi:TRAP-type C4-dicarboxylate transport system permease small subunit
VSAARSAAAESLGRGLDRVTEWLGIAAGLALVGVMTVMVFDVLFRYVFTRPIKGVQDLVQLGLLLVVFLGIGYCGRTGGHVAVDVFERFMGERLRRAADVLVRALGAAIYAALAWRVWQSGVDAGTYRESSNLLAIPFQPFYFVVAGGAALYAAVLLAELFIGPTRAARQD